MNKALGVTGYKIGGGGDFGLNTDWKWKWPDESLTETGEVG